MLRRRFLLSSAAFSCAPVALQAYPAESFSPALWSSLSDTSDVVVLNYRASWSLTCQIKADILAKLLSENPDYERLTFIDVDWDQHKRSDLVKSLNVPRRSTLIALKGDKELGRIVAGTGKSQIKSLMDTALQAASA